MPTNGKQGGMGRMGFPLLITVGFVEEMDGMPNIPKFKGLRGTAKKCTTGIGMNINIKITEVRAPLSI